MAGRTSQAKRLKQAILSQLDKMRQECEQAGRDYTQHLHWFIITFGLSQGPHTRTIRDIHLQLIAYCENESFPMGHPMNYIHAWSGPADNDQPNVGCRFKWDYMALATKLPVETDEPFRRILDRLAAVNEDEGFLDAVPLYPAGADADQGEEEEEEEEENATAVCTAPKAGTLHPRFLEDIRDYIPRDCDVVDNPYGLLGLTAKTLREKLEMTIDDFSHAQISVRRAQKNLVAEERELDQQRKKLAADKREFAAHMAKQREEMELWKKTQQQRAAKDPSRQAVADETLARVEEKRKALDKRTKALRAFCTT